MKKSKGWDYHKSTNGKDEWLTPPKLIESLGEFDLDPCSPINRPWSTARNHFTIEDNGLLKIWSGRVFCNPPYSQASRWLARCAEHGNSIALVFARTETNMFFDYIFNSADSIMFLRKRLTFLNVDGSTPKYTSGGPSCLVAWGRHNTAALANSNLIGHLVKLKNDTLGLPATEITEMSKSGMPAEVIAAFAGHRSNESQSNYILK